MDATRCIRNQDALNTEFIYYSSVLRIIAPALSILADKEMIAPWIKKLFRPEYHSSKFREKRNKYLADLTISLLNDEAFGIFMTSPPEGALAELCDIKVDTVPAAEWETDKTWQETLLALPDDFIVLECSVHDDKEECKNDHSLDKILDQEFQLMLYIVRPYAAMVSNGEDRTKVASWIQILCSICNETCSSMKAIRNDYMMALMGYLQDLRIAGPFRDYAPWKTLVPLANAAKDCCGDAPVTDPTGPEADAFLSDQPVPDDGAFCYVALTGDLVNTVLNND